MIEVRMTDGEIMESRDLKEDREQQKAFDDSVWYQSSLIFHINTLSGKVSKADMSRQVSVILELDLCFHGHTWVGFGHN